MDSFSSLLRRGAAALAAGAILFTAACGGASAPAQSAAASGAQGQPSDTAKLALYMGADRQKILEDGARKEGTLSFYTSGILESATGQMIKKFQEAYPFVKIETFRADDSELIRRVTEEAGANQNMVDLLETTPTGLLPLKSRGLIGSFNSPNAANFIDAAKEPSGNNDGGYSWVVIRESYQGIGWNTDKVKADDAPKTLDDLLDPKWQGKMAVPNSYETVIGSYVSVKGEDFVKKLAVQKIKNMQVSARQLADLVIAGEIPMSPMIASSHVTDSAGKGAPIAWRAIEPVTTNPGSIALPAKPAHPYAALLYIDYVLSQVGAQTYDQFGYGVPRTDFDGKYTLAANVKRFYPTQVPNFEQAYTQWHQLLLDITTK
jgi:iron(III) transport system substrate-binding protein